MTTLDPVIKDKWVKALRSGEYKQYRGAMRNVEATEFCCLGVLARVMIPCQFSGTKIPIVGLLV